MDSKDDEVLACIGDEVAEINDQDDDDDDDLASIFVQTKYGRQTTGWKKNLYI